MTKQKENFITSTCNKKKNSLRDGASKGGVNKEPTSSMPPDPKPQKPKIADDNIEQGKGVLKGYSDKTKKCTAKQEAFARQYLVARCKVSAYKYAYDCENMNPNSIRKKAVDVYNTPCVNNRIMELQEESNKRIEITTDKIQQGIAKLAFTDLPGIINLKGGLLTLAEFDCLTDRQRSCIKKFKVKTFMRVVNDVEMQCEFVEVEVYDKHAALVTLAKINQMLVDKSEIKHSGKITQESVEISKEDYAEIRAEMLKNDKC